MIYSKAAAHISKALEEMIDIDSMRPWDQIEKELKTAIKKDDTAVKHIMMMSDGILASLAIGGTMALNSIKDREEQDKQMHMAMLDIISTSMLRAFAMGVHCQRAVAEVETLETLAKR